MHGVRRILFFYVVPSTFFAFFGPQAIPADTCLEEVSRSWLSIVLRILSANTQSQCIHLEAALCDVACREKNAQVTPEFLLLLKPPSGSFN
ncbi:hypothetical protein BGY98DRAFT_964485 [Russula aff. rugulosa BPL654]|nr:hypothetical protein BGY98DRAFT_964485 [Russula aff. rugulosa BPL654]